MQNVFLKDTVLLYVLFRCYVCIV